MNEGHTPSPLLEIAELLTEDCSDYEKLRRLGAQIGLLYRMPQGVILLREGASSKPLDLDFGSPTHSPALEAFRTRAVAARGPLVERDAAGSLRAAFPIRSGARHHGTLLVQGSRKTELSDEEHKGLETLARLMATCLDRAHLQKLEHDRRARFECVSEVARVVHTEGDLEAALQRTGEILARAIQYHRIILVDRRPSGGFGVRTVSAPSGSKPAQVRVHTDLEAKNASRLEAVLMRRRTLTVYPQTDEDLLGEPTLLEGIGRYVIVPISSGPSLLGALAFGFEGHRPTPEWDVLLIEEVALHFVAALLRERRARTPSHAGLEAEDGLRTLGELVAGVAHDFNNVLSAILGRAQMLKHQVQGGDHRHSLEVIEKAALDGASTVRRIQEFAKKSVDALAPVDVDQLARDGHARAETKLAQRSPEHSVQLALELGASASVLGSPSELRQVLTNLIYNAADAMPEGGRLTVRTGQDEATARAWFEVEDTGMGMSPETRQHMFDPFFTTKGRDGTGLGLSVSYQVVQRHGGEFTVHSEEGRGSRIRVALPALGQTRPTLDRAAVGKGPSPLLRRTQTCGSILLIDDDTAVRDTLAEILVSEGHEVVSVRGGAEGLSTLEAGTFDLVLTDLGMPDMNGWEVAERVRAKDPGMPVGVITGWGASLDEARLEEFGVDLILAKPFRYDQVLEVVRKVLGTRR